MLKVNLRYEVLLGLHFINALCFNSYFLLIVFINLVFQSIFLLLQLLFPSYHQPNGNKNQNKLSIVIWINLLPLHFCFVNAEQV